MPVSRETVLYYDPKGGQQTVFLKSILVQMGARIKNIAPESVGQTVGCLLGRKGFDARDNPEAPALAEPMLVLDGFTDKRLEILLRKMKEHGVSVPYKAIVTETNIGWIFHQLYEELVREHETLGK
nr:DUF3783 domain-containing protein [uncultured Agathobaculum sp.]